MTEYLVHHGIKGQKWGVRRYQNADGTLTSAGKKRYQTDASGRMTEKGAKNWYKDNRGTMMDAESAYDDEFDKTDNGKRLWSQYEKELNKMYDNVDWEDDPQNQERFSTAEESYLRKRAEYSAKKLIEEFGDEKASIYANRGRINTGKDAVQALSDEWWIHAS